MIATQAHPPRYGRRQHQPLSCLKTGSGLWSHGRARHPSPRHRIRCVRPGSPVLEIEFEPGLRFDRRLHIEIDAIPPGDPAPFISNSMLIPRVTRLQTSESMLTPRVTQPLHIETDVARGTTRPRTSDSIRMGG